jgi:hypothetical protein
MSIFETILEKLGIHKPAASAGAGQPASHIPPSMMSPGAPRPAAAMPAGSAAVPVVDVMTKLNNLAGENSGLDWKVSIVDLLKLLGMDSSFDHRKKLATELGCPADLMGDSAKMNTWLHKTVLQKIAENGGNIPQSLLH